MDLVRGMAAFFSCGGGEGWKILCVFWEGQALSISQIFYHSQEIYWYICYL